MPSKTSNRRGLAALALLSATVLAGCEGDPITGDHDDEPDVGGFVIRAGQLPGGGSVELYRYTDEDAAQPDTLFLESATTYDIDFDWLDHDGEPTTLEAGLATEVEVTQPGIATFTATGASSGTLVTPTVASSVTTSMRVRLWHEEEGHHDYESVYFPVKVSP